MADKDPNDEMLSAFDLPYNSPVKPQKLTLDDTIQFRCHKEIECFNACCLNIDITLTPYDVLRLARNLKISTTQFIAKFTQRYDLDFHGMPGVKMKPVEDGTACQFVVEQGCAVYEDRPTACRYYALGTMGMVRKDSASYEDVYFLVREPHCKGHEQNHQLTVREYRVEQKVEDYDDLNRDWLDIIIKKRSAGPTVGAPSERSFQLFYLGYDVDAFRSFTQSDGFKKLFNLSDDERHALDNDDSAVVRFITRFLKQTLFGEMTIAVASGAAKDRYNERKDVIQKKHQEAVEKYRLRDPTEGSKED